MKLSAKLACIGFLFLVVFTVPALCQEIQIQIAPSTLNLTHQGTWVTVHADIAYSIVDTATVELNGIEVVSTFADDCGNLVAKFNADDVKAILEPGSAVLTLKGTTKDRVPFLGEDAIRIVDVGGKK